MLAWGVGVIELSSWAFIYAPAIVFVGVRHSRSSSDEPDGESARSRWKKIGKLTIHDIFREISDDPGSPVSDYPGSPVSDDLGSPGRRPRTPCDDLIDQAPPNILFVVTRDMFILQSSLFVSVFLRGATTS